ncbi:MAG: SDR family oxidoreductase [Actinomycetia bacterium]|nr:SDR family oxidoreductase [Actinomycetes bacterium]
MADVDSPIDPDQSPGELLDLSGRVAIVTGSSGGIGAGIARRFSAAGASVVLHHRAGPPIDLPGPSVSVAADLNHPDGPTTVMAAAVDAWGRVDALVNSAGIQPVAGFLDLTDADWQAMVDTNLTAVHRLTRAAAEQMVDQGDGGAVVHIASIEGSQPAAGHSHYATTKAGLLMHARAAALELGSHGIRVNSVSPGLIGRPGLDDVWPEGVERWRAAAPLGRLGEPADIGDACVFLCSPLARWITGTDLVVDGGVSTHPTW